MLSHGNLTAMSQGCTPDIDPIDADEAVVYAAPMSHCAGLYSLIHVRRATRHVVPESRDFKADELFGLASGFGHITLFVAPTMFTSMVEQGRRQGHDGKGIKTIIYGDAPIYPTELRNVLLRNNYGELLKTELRMWLTASANDTHAP
ncbi:AMP-binding protein [Pseudomonas sp. PCH446]